MKHCAVCGCLMSDKHEDDVCECCQDDMNEGGDEE